MTFRSVKNPLNSISISDILVKIKTMTNIIISAIIQCNSTNYHKNKLVSEYTLFISIRTIEIFPNFSRSLYIQNYSLNV